MARLVEALVRAARASRSRCSRWRRGAPTSSAGSTGPRPGETLCLEGHTDVVTEGDPDAWRHPAVERPGRGRALYGRGAADMKGGLAAAMVAAAAVRRGGVRLAGRLVVAALVDEEGAMTGAKHFVGTPLGREPWTRPSSASRSRTSSASSRRGSCGRALPSTGAWRTEPCRTPGVNPMAAAGQFLARAAQLERRARRGVPRSRFLGRPTSRRPLSERPVGSRRPEQRDPGGGRASLDVRLTPGSSREASSRPSRRWRGRRRAGAPARGSPSSPSSRPGRRPGSAAARSSSRRSSGRSGA